MNKHSNELLPVKTKKKKNSFLQDDDFFVIRKNKKAKTVHDGSNSINSSSPLLAKPSEVSQLASALPSADNIDSDDLIQSFHSAKDSFPIEEVQPEVVTNDEHKANSHLEQVPGKVPSRSDDDVDDLDVDLNAFFKDIKKSQFMTTKSETGESGRIYILKIISKYGMPLEAEIAVSGDSTFGSVLNDLGTGDKQLPFLGVNGVLLWVEGKSELKRFYKPSTLRIPMPANGAPTSMTILYVPPEHAEGFESIYPEFQAKMEAEEPNIIDLLEASEAENTSEHQDNVIKNKSNFFVIGLKGRDNKRIECEVGPDTKIRDLLSYYLKVKRIGEKSVKNPRLVFDDEELDLEGLVRDTELEDEFEVQVYI